VDFKFSPEQQAIVEGVREIVKAVVAPRAAEIDEREEFPWDIKEAFSKNDIFAIAVPPELGGVSGSSLSLCLAIEEVAKVCASSAVILAVQALGTYPLLIAGSEEQRRRYCPELAKGNILAAYALTEPGSGSDAAGMKTRAVRYGNEYVINGTKVFITSGDVADIVIVFAKTDPDKGSKGITAFIVEKDGSNVEVARLEKKMGIRGSTTAQLIFHDCKVPAANVLGSEGEGFKIALKVLDRSRPSIGAQALGIAEGAFEYAKQYVQERTQFGQPIASFEAIQFMLADMATQIEAARLLVYRAAKMVDEQHSDLTKAAAMAKLFASDTAMRVTTDAVQLLGGYGYLRDYPVERMMRDAKITQIYEGTNQIQRLVIARQLLKQV